MKKININENQYSTLLEYHHAYGKGLEQDAENIAYIATDMFKNNYGLKTYYIQSLDKKIDVKLVDSSICACDNYGEFIQISKKYTEEAISSNDIQRLSSLIYHELGHLTNILKCNDNKEWFNTSQTRKDFTDPLFLFLDTADYEKIMTMLYRFHSRELKARCFETTMFLKKNKNPNITIQDIYNDRCSDITMMREFLSLLKQGEIEGPESKYGKILNDIGKSTWQREMRFKKYSPNTKKTYQYNNGRVSWKYNAKNTINYFTKRYLWLKKRIDKIFYDYMRNKL